MMRRSDSGYSLLELMIALALIGFIAVAISGGMRFGSRAWETSDGKLGAIEQVHGAQALLRTLLQQAIPRALDPAIPGDAMLFRGGSGWLTFTAQAPSAFGAKGFTQFDLSVADAREGKQLVLAWQSAGTSKETRTLLNGARSIAISYGERTQDGAINWVTDWQEQSGAPALVMVRAAFDARSAMRWPDLVVRTRITQDPQCLYDADTFSCRHG